MNLRAHMSRQVPGQVPNQGSTQLSGLAQHRGSSLPSRIPNLGILGMDSELDAARKAMRDKIYNYLERRYHPSSDDWLRRLPELARRLEERVFKEATSKEDYFNMVREPVENRLHSIVRNLPNYSQPLPQNVHITSSSTSGTMIPTPGIPHNSSTSSTVSCSAEIPSITTSSAGMVAQHTNVNNLLPTANGLSDVGRTTSLSSSNVPICNGFQHPSGNVALGPGGSNIVSSMASMGVPREFSQMIPTPGFNNLQTVPVNSDCTNEVFSGMESTLAPQPQQQKHYEQQKQFVGSHNSHILHSLGGQIGGMRSNMQQKPYSYGFSNGPMHGGLGLVGSNMQLVNGPVASEGYLGTAPYGGSPKPTQQQLDQQHNQPKMPTSYSQQTLPTVADGFAMKAADVAGSGSLYVPGSSVLSAMNNPNMNSACLQSKSRTNPAMVASHASSQKPPHMRSQMFDHSQKVDFQPSQSTHEHLLQSQQQMQQHQQLPNQTYSHFGQNQHQPQRQQRSLQHQSHLLKNDSLRQSSVTSSFGEQLMPEIVAVSHNESLLPQSAEQAHLPELGSRYQRNTPADDKTKGPQPVVQLSGSQDFQCSFSQCSQQSLHPHKQADEYQNEVIRNGSQPEALSQVQWQPQSLQKTQMPGKPSLERHIKEEFHQRVTGQEEAQRPSLSLEGCNTSCASNTMTVSVPQISRGVTRGAEKSTQERNYLRQQKWLLFLYHARWCSAPEGKCQDANCITAQRLLTHTKACTRKQCGYPRCSGTKRLFHHFRNCHAADCPVCVPVRKYLASYKAHARAASERGMVSQMNSSWRSISAVDADRMKADAKPIETSDDKQSFPKRMKVQHVSSLLVPKSEPSPIPVPVPPANQHYGALEPQPPGCKQTEITVPTKSEVIDVKIDPPMVSGQKKSPVFGNFGDGGVHTTGSDIKPGVSSDADGHGKQETTIKKETMVTEKEFDQAKFEAKHEANDPLTDAAGSKSGKPKIKGVSLTELFTPEQVREHIVGLRQWVGQSKAKAEKNQAMEHSMSENSCQLCAVEKLTFEPPPIYCSPCGARIKRNAMYYTIGSGETRLYFCIPCYNEARGDTMEVDGVPYQKAKLEKKKNDEETEEWWVQCDKCEAWQHQICALFNGRRNDGGQAEYTCPNCYIEEVERGERKPLPQSAVLGAKDLPRTILSDHIEQRLSRRLKQERQERARHFGKNYDEVPGAEGLVVRVVSSVDKKLEVKQRFLEIFQEENYPTEFPYKSKAILLFQKIEGVEVCLFGMYVQEFGSECSFPNQRRVYLSYLDSVKYFRPEIKTVTGEALRTFVYHEILIGYLEYCKIRGFTSCYIWACPPLKGEDYILYCHPEIQKTPKSDKLREWYLSMLRKASKENIVVDLINLYDHFFVSTGECKAKVTAARLPYFDGDYWPGAAEDMINQLRQEEDGRKQQKKGKTKKTVTKRALKAAGQADLAGNASKDALLMHKLGDTICPMKEDFIMVHLQHACTHCCTLMVSGTRWVCNQCKNFQLCDKCHEAEQRREERDRHPINSREKHALFMVEINDVAQDTKDPDEILESEFFDTRQAFLSLCQGNHYQYDTLRRAKHSSMMVLYHLHNPTAPAFVTTCNVCYHDIETGQGWRCEVCADFDVCNPCYQKGGIDHPHKLTNHPSTADRDAQNKEARQKRVLQLRKMLDLLVHASQCRFPHCQYPNCRKVKGLFRHGIQCKTRASGGCLLCKKMWYLLQLHARACKESECTVPRCKDLKEHLKRLQQQSDSRRRAAVMEMMRQRAAEVAGSTG